MLGLPCCAGFSPVAASRVALWLQCTGSSLQWLLLQRSRGSRAHGLPWVQRVGSAVVTHRHMALCSRLPPRRLRSGGPPVGMTWTSTNTRLPCPASWREAACPQEPLFLPCQSLIAAGPPGSAHLTWVGSTQHLSPQ